MIALFITMTFGGDYLSLPFLSGELSAVHTEN
jgi:hypothetical protein